MYKIIKEKQSLKTATNDNHPIIGSWHGTGAYINAGIKLV